MISKDNLKIFILAYKNFKCPVHNSSLYRIIDLKDDNAIKNDDEFKYDIPIIYTDNGDTISDKNAIYDEWTGIYWLWKNYDWKDTEYIGLCQYRRYFHFLDQPSFENMQNYNAFVGGYIEQPMTNAEAYSFFHNLEDIKCAYRHIDNDMQYYAAQFLLSNRFFPSNLLIISKDDFFDLCNFVFTTIFKVQDTLGIHSENDAIEYVQNNLTKFPHRDIEEDNFTETIKYQKQILAFLMERLCNIWITKKLYNFNDIMSIKCVETEYTGQDAFDVIDVD